MQGISKKFSALAVLWMILWAPSGCLFDPSPLDARRCTVISQCGQGELCVDGFCQTDRRVDTGCASDVDCDDGQFCNGEESCDPADPSGDVGGCVAGVDPVEALPPQEDCIEAVCDEEGDALDFDTRGCGCPGGDASECPQAPPCRRFTCSAELVCVLEDSPVGTVCDDGASCTLGDVCDDRGACVPGEASDGACADGLFCNGDEVCDPTDADANEAGCVSGEVPGLDDGVDCTVDDCDEGSDTLTHTPGPGCGCEGEGDPACAEAFEGPCETGVCDAETLNCVRVPLEEGSACDPIDCGSGPVAGVCGSGRCLRSPEGTTGGSSCGDGLDNDCDGDTDAEDSDCLTPTSLTLEGPQSAQVGLDAEGALLFLTPTRADRGVTNQTANLYCVSRTLDREEPLVTRPAQIAILDQGNNVADNPSQVTFGDTFNNDDPRPGARICDGYSLILGPYPMPEPNGEVDYSTLLTVSLGGQFGQLGPGQYLVMSYRTEGTSGLFTPLVMVGDAELDRLLEYAFHIASEGDIEIRLQVIDADGDAEGSCGFASSLRLERTPTIPPSGDRDRAYPDWTFANTTEAAHQDFQRVEPGLFVNPLSLGRGNHELTTGNDASVAGNNKGLRWRFKDGLAGFLQLPALSGFTFDRSNPLVMDFHGSMKATEMDENEVFHVGFGINIDFGDILSLLDLRRLASIIPENLGNYSFYGNHYDYGATALDNRYVIIMPEEAKAIAGRTLGFAGPPVSHNDERAFIDELQFFVHTTPATLDMNTEALGPEAPEDPTHLVRLGHAQAGQARVQCFWQIPNDAQTITLASEPVLITFD